MVVDKIQGAGGYLYKSSGYLARHLINRKLNTTKLVREGFKSAYWVRFHYGVRDPHHNFEIQARERRNLCLREYYIIQNVKVSYVT